MTKITKKQSAGGLRLADIRNATKTIAIDLSEYGFEGVEPLEITFKTNFWTAERQNIYWAEDKTLSQSDIELLCEYVTKWNLSDDGKPMAISNDTFDKLNFTIVHGIVTEMIRAISPNPPTSTT